MQSNNLLDEWQLDPTLIHVNHAAVGPWPKRTKHAICQFAEENAHQGSLSYPQWITTESQLRQQLKQLINAESSDSIALLKNTSEALSVVAYGLNWQAGDNIVISDEEFPSNRVVWQSLQARGVDVKEISLQQESTAEESLMAACDNKTKLLSISSVQYASGVKVDLNTLGDFCQQKTIFFCVDAIQSLAAEPCDVQANNADFVVADGHKWMLGPEGIALFYCKPEVMEKLNLNQFGWHMLENYLDFNDKNWQIAHSARRFECGSPNMLGIHGLNASLSLILEIGLDNIQQLIQQKVDFLFDKLEAIDGITIRTPRDPAQRLGIFSFKSKQHDAEKIFTKLSEHQVFCALRDQNVRFSPHYYTPMEQLEKIVDLIESL